MMRTLLISTLVGVVALVGKSWADEEKVALDKLPPAVSAAAKKRFPKAEFTEASKEVEDGKTMYEISLKDGGHKIDATFTADGKLTTIEKQIASKDLPKAVVAALSSKYPGASYKTVEEVIQVKDGNETLAYYETLLETPDHKRVEVEVGTDGMIKKTEDKTGKKD
jgi:hypothetical protein